MGAYSMKSGGSRGNMFLTMIRAAAVALIIAGLAAAQGASQGAAKKSDAARQPSAAKAAPQPKSSEPEAKPYAPKPLMPPAGAVEIRPHEWRYIEKGSGGKPDKVWIYRRTPFGLAKSEEETSSDVDPSTGIEAVDKGASVEFSSNSPFGIKRWTRKKTEMDELEKAAYARAAKKAAAAK
jgi:hypothetical protein